MLIWGPADTTSASDGSFWVTDTVGDRLLQFNRAGEVISEIDLSGHIVSATDLDVRDKEIFALDKSSMPPRLVRVALDGEVLGPSILPAGLGLEDGLSAVALGDSGVVLVELEGGAALAA